MNKQPKERKCANKDCKGTFIQYRSTQKVCSIQCAIKIAEKQREDNSKRLWRQTKREMQQKLETTQKLAKKAQFHFNAYIRERDRGKKCISCNTILTGKFDAGHYYNSNNHWAVRYDPQNVWGQCVRCNRDLHGNLINYRFGLLIILGEEGLQKMDERAMATRKFTREELISIIEEYKAKKNDLLKRQ